MTSKFYSLFSLALCFWSAPTVRAQTGQQLNFSEHIAPIVYNHCARCHRPGEVAPFSLLSYADVASRATTVAAVTGSRYMPPWKPDPSYRHFLDENTLSQPEIDQIRDWVLSGAPQGNPALAPPVPTFPSGSQLGTPDLVVPMAQRFSVPGNGQDLYRVFVLAVALPADRDVAAVEFRAGNKRLVHHAILALDTTQQGQVRDGQDPGYGYTQFGGFGFDPTENNWSVWAPGGQTRFWPAGMGKKLYRRATLLLQIHYGPTPVPQTDSSVVNIFFSRQPVTRYVTTAPAVAPFGLTNGPFVIPAGQVRAFHYRFSVPLDISLLSVAPHAHLLGKSWKIWAVKPNGDTLKLVKIDDWNCRWQGNFRFPNLLRLPAGSRLEADVTYDNTAANPRNPHSPPQTATWGENTTDEMLLAYFDAVPYRAGDEQIALATRASLPAVTTFNPEFSLHPNPAELSAATATFRLTQAGPVSLSVRDERGRLVRPVLADRNMPGGPQQVPLPLEGLPAGLYLVQLEAAGAVRTEKLLVK